MVLIVYPYLIYPVVIALIGQLHPQPVRRAPQLPSMSILIPAYNEIECIDATIQNKLQQNYPSDKLQIIVVSDGSTDGTDEVVRGFADRGVRLLRREGREGKAAALNAAVRLAHGEILVFSDANTLFGEEALLRLAENFADPQVGYLTGSMGFIHSAASTISSSGVSAYMRYENLVRRLETRAGSIIGVNGGVDAIRRDLYVDIPPQLITDFVLPLSVIAGGHRVIHDPLVTACEVANSETSSEFRMRIRVALRALQGLVYMRRLLNPWRYPYCCFCLMSHKVLRYAGFVFMIMALISNALLGYGSGLYQSLLALHVATYGIALLGLATNLPGWLKRITVIPSYVLLSNAAFALAAARFLRGDTMAIWRPRAG